MAYGDYLDSATLQGTITPNMSAPPGEAADVAWIKNGENAEQTITNRPHKAIADNCDILKERLDDEIAITQTAALTTFSGTSLTIDPTNGGGSDINFSGTLYLGTGYTDNQENRDTLFQFLDENYNEVMVDGNEVKVSAVAGGTVGSGFYNSGIVTLTLSETVVSGNYRLRYAIGSSLAGLPDDALITADIRGVHEAAGESAKPSVVVCAPAGGQGDFIGSTALADAISAVGDNATIFLRAGIYDLATAPSMGDGVHIVGEAYRYPSSGASIRFTGASATWTLGDHCSIRNVDISVQTPNGSHVIQTNDYHNVIENVTLYDTDLECYGYYVRVENVEMRPYQDAIRVECVESSFKNITIYANGTAPTNGLLRFATASGGQTVFENIYINAATLSNATGIFFGNSSNYLCTFKNVYVRVGGGGVGIDLDNASFFLCEFTNCRVESGASALVGDDSVRQRGIVFSNCLFSNSTGAWYRVPAIRLRCKSPDDTNANSSYSCAMYNCSITDRFCTGNTDPADPGGTPTSGTAFPVVELEGVHVENLLFDRSTITYNVEDSPWLKLTNCKGSRIAVKTGTTAAMTPFIYSAAGDGLVEIVDQSRVSNVKVMLEYVNEVKRAIVYTKGLSDHDDTAVDARGMITKIDGLQISFDNGTAWRTGGETALGLQMAGHSVVKDFMWNAGVSNAKRNDAGSIGITNAVVYMGGDYNLLENCQIDVDCANRGNVNYVIDIGDHSDFLDHHNTVRGGKISIKYGTAIDPNTQDYPYKGIYVRGAGSLIEGVTIFTDDPQNSTDDPIYVNGEFARVIGCFVTRGDCLAGSCMIRWSGTNATGTAVGNIGRATATTAQGVLGSPAGDSGNVAVIDTTAYPLS